jgi:hypothetical protein
VNEGDTLLEAVSSHAMTEVLEAMAKKAELSYLLECFKSITDFHEYEGATPYQNTTTN